MVREAEDQLTHSESTMKIAHAATTCKQALQAATLAVARISDMIN